MSVMDVLVTTDVDGIEEIRQWCKDTIGYVPTCKFEAVREDFLARRKPKVYWEMQHRMRFEFPDEEDATYFALKWL